MTRANITVDSLRKAGYEPFEFSDYTMEQGIEDIKRGCEVMLQPRYPGYMVAVVIVAYNGQEYHREMCTRPMTAHEKRYYAGYMAEQEKHDKEVTAKINARNKAKLRRR